MKGPLLLDLLLESIPRIAGSAIPFRAPKPSLWKDIARFLHRDINQPEKNYTTDSQSVVLGPQHHVLPMSLLEIKTHAPHLQPTKLELLRICPCIHLTNPPSASHSH